jgi:hypothetical protein
MEKFFHPGRVRHLHISISARLIAHFLQVLAMLWQESTGTALSDGRKQTYIKGRYQVEIYSTIRRMVILKTFGSYSWCM